MTTTVRDDPSRDRYELLVDDQFAGFAAYRRHDACIEVLHTEIDEAYSAQGLGKRLVTGLLADLDERGLAVVPRCPYVRKVIAEDAPRYLHLVPEEVQESLGLVREEASPPGL